MNIREFAKYCGVSPSAVSRILNRSQKESQTSVQTYERVRKLATEMNFRPNYAAKSLHTQKSNCIGVIIGTPASINTLPILQGISEVTNATGYSLAITNCNYSLRMERDAMRNMLYRRVDGIIWHPTLQRGPYRTGHVQRVLAQSDRHVPVVCLSTVDLPGLYTFKFDWLNDPAEAALRQLAQGCRKFGIVSSEYTIPQLLSGMDAYKNTLLSHGIPAENIVTVGNRRRNEDWSQLQGIDGMWAMYLIQLHILLPQLETVCDLQKLHVDVYSSTSDYTTTKLIAPKFSSRFASIVFHHMDATDIARRGTKTIIQAIANPTMEPAEENIDWTVTFSHNAEPRSP